MIIGRLDRRITLQHRVLTKNDRGEDIVTYSDYSTVWSGKRDMNAREYFAAQQMNAELTTEFTIRWRDDVLYTDRIVLSSVPYNIRNVAEIGTRVGLKILATAVPA